MGSDGTTHMDLHTPIRDFRERQGGVAWPLPVDAHLDRLLAAARSVGERTSRKEIVAALVAFAAVDGDELSALVRRYRLATVGDVLPAGETDDNVVTFQPHGPGPRRSSP